ncbi:hypothetical protein T265_07909 [Opisthorchis viverrini]|uniref:Uncharacterized protein n=1 Tax=Opisthorchis viverrini TaxID=6198 RepID=A0A074ZAU9_OPIVI|nr:hypothetical protein T265_07909 [Opisthorchis viverrini]KER24436.1 hypothetical protein T265_07909 [Opisthorchis viverrini]
MKRYFQKEAQHIFTPQTTMFHQQITVNAILSSVSRLEQEIPEAACTTGVFEIKLKLKISPENRSKMQKGLNQGQKVLLLDHSEELHKNILKTSPIRTGRVRVWNPGKAVVGNWPTPPVYNQFRSMAGKLFLDAKGPGDFGHNNSQRSAYSWSSPNAFTPSRLHD